MAYKKLNCNFDLTSTRVGHQYQEANSFPPVEFQRTVTKKLPPPLCQNEQIKDFYLTTNGTAHNYKPKHSSLQNDIYKKAPGHWNVKYTEDTITKIQVKPQRKALTMGNQKSEMKDKFKGNTLLPLNSTFSSDVQPQMYRKQFGAKVLDRLIPCQNHPISERDVFNYHGDMYLTTNRKEHRHFTKGELRKYPKKEYSSYWQCEGYPKAWGHGSKSNPLPPDSVPREAVPLRDQLIFKTATITSRLPKTYQVVPNSGMCSEAAASYKDIPSQERKVLFECPVPKPWDLKNTSSDGIFTVPKMYNTEYQTIGSGRMQPV